MRKLVKELCILLSVSALMLVLTNWVYIVLDQSDLNDTKKYQMIPDNITISNIGSSHGEYAFDYNELPNETGFNFALSSASLSYDYRVLLAYEDHLENNGVMFIPVSYFSLYGVDEIDRSEFESKNKRYYDILPPKYIKNYSFMTDVYEHWLPVVSAQERLFEVLTGNTYNEREELWSRSAWDIDVMEDAEQAHYRHFEQYGSQLNQNEVQALYDIVEFCKSKNIRPIMITTPYLNEYNHLVSEDFLEDFHAVIADVELTGAEYYDYSSDERFSNEYDYFMNSDHLNIEGARKFTDIIKTEILDCGD